MWKADGGGQTFGPPVSLKRPYNNKESAGFDAWVMIKHEKQQRAMRTLAREEGKHHTVEETEHLTRTLSGQRDEKNKSIGSREGAKTAVLPKTKEKKRKSKRISVRRSRKRSTGAPYKESPRFKHPKEERKVGECVSAMIRFNMSRN